MTNNTTDTTPVAVVTGGSHGLGRAITTALIGRSWAVVTDGRGADALEKLAARIDSPRLTTVAGDVNDPRHREALVKAAGEVGPVSLLVNNASRLGPSPQPALRDYPGDELQAVYDADVFAPLALVQALLPALVARAGVIVNVSSDAAVDAYDGWGGYGSAKAALDQLTAVLAVEEPGLSVYSFDPGDMRTLMHQQAFPGEDISDRPEPETVVPAFLHLIDKRPPSGRFRNSELQPIGASA